MKLQGTAVFLLPIIFIFTSTLAYTHDGHDTEDIVLKDLGNLGQVNFATSCPTETQKAFNTGLGLIHHMMYAQAEQLFSQLIKQHPNCAMLYWGYSMSLFHPLWPDKISNEALAKGHKALEIAVNLEKTQREKSYVEAAQKYYENWKTTPEKHRINAWAKAHKALHHAYPDDIDATTLYALTLLVTASKHDKTFSANKLAGKALSAVVDMYPLHPGGIHYSIHAYDNPELAKLGLKAARAYDKIAPDVPHALHMPTHIFIRLGEWQDAINWNSRSANAALKYPTKNTTSMHYVHALDYKTYAQLQLGKGQKALKTMQESEAFHPIQNTFPAAYALASMPARIFLEQRDWLKASQLETRSPSYMSWEKFPEVEAITYFARGIGSARSNNMAAARANLAKLEELYKKTQTSSPSYWAILVNAQRKAVQAWIYFAEGKTEPAITLLNEAASIEESVDKNPVTPGTVLPIRELLGDMYVLANDHEHAKKAFLTSLSNAPKRRYSEQALIDINNM